MLYSGTDPESYITEYTLVYEEYGPGGQARGGVPRDVSDPSLPPPPSVPVLRGVYVFIFMCIYVLLLYIYMYVNMYIWTH